MQDIVGWNPNSQYKKDKCRWTAHCNAEVFCMGTLPSLRWDVKTDVPHGTIMNKSYGDIPGVPAQYLALIKWQ